MDDKEFNLEETYLSKALDSIDTERRELDARLTDGIEAANEQTAESITQQFLKRLKILILIKDKPYFARIDFKTSKEATERLYLGKLTVIDEKGKTIVIDWRAPISTLYYEGRVGQASYSCEDGIIDGEILLKRQFEIEKRRLISYNDIDITFDEELLKPYLSVGSNTRLKNIIATIQAEQNRIIRAGLLKPLIVQGVAGSGKTTVALHRIAYLIYATSIKPEQFLIIAPNAIFLDYISNVLPDLGVENVNQKTFEAFAQDFIGKKLKIEDPGEKLNRIIDGKNSNDEITASGFKSSLLFRDAIELYLKDIERTAST
jgi:DNA helicase II / ATP-dependent DNA helicase PcrA